MIWQDDTFVEAKKTPKSESDKNTIRNKMPSKGTEDKGDRSLDDTVNDLERWSSDLDKHKVRGGKSIIARSRNAVMQFPIYMSKSVAVSEAHTISKMFERVYASFMQTVLSENPVIDDISEVNDLAFLRKYHTNLSGMPSTVSTKSMAAAAVKEYYEPIDTLDRMICEAAYCHRTSWKFGNMVFEAVDPDGLIVDACRLLSYVPLHGFNYLQEDSSVPTTQDTKTTKAKETTVATKSEVRDISEQELIELAKANGIGQEFNLDPNDSSYEDKLFTGITGIIAAGTDERLDHWLTRDNYKLGYEINTKFNPKETVSMNNYPFKFIGRRNTIDRRTVEKSGSEILSKQMMATKPPELLKEVEISKINGMLPWQMNATFIVNDPKGTREMTFRIGIKTVLHPIDYTDLSNDLRDLVTGNMKTLQKVRYRTGEISFWKDYILNIDQIKSDAAKSITGKEWLGNLKRLGRYGDLHGTLFKKPVSMIAGGATPIPNGTMVITDSDMMSLKITTGIDLYSLRNVRKMTDSLFLMAFVIVNPTAGTMSVFYPDVDSDWDIQSLAAVDAQVGKAESSQLLSELRRASRQ